MELHDQFVSIFPEIVENMKEFFPPKEEFPKEASNYLLKMVEHNVPDGKHYRGMTVVNTFLTLSDKRDQKSIREALILGWCLEFYHAFRYVADDVVEGSKTRRGRKCWHQIVGMIGINDSFTLEGFVFQLLKKYFGKHPHYLELVELFLDSGFCSELGRTLSQSTIDYKTHKPLFSKYNENYFQKMIRLKTSIVAFYLPIALGITLATRKAISLDSLEHQRKLNEAKKVMLQLGEYYIIKEEIVNNFSEKNANDNSDKDIQLGKCSWLIVAAIKHSNEEQIQKLKVNYGIPNQKATQIVKEIYNQLNLVRIYQDFEQKSFNSITQSLDNLKYNPKEIFSILLNQIFYRKN
ncbi:farnesyl-pyrophosphate synthetase [Anaeramoeba flamelloides]|uniref:Farnesyl-pyrophosphate synthetase n=1 Tax=Anaeramoeba flamelloides TaxID=1746091 RepID=A0ABQ8XV89_9EUKA|nr:farnesyl-pyrophosphate synthetase [Anaeramoeba flamelloides]